MTPAERALLIEVAYALASIAQYETRLKPATAASMQGAELYRAWCRQRLYTEDGKPVTDNGRQVLAGELIMRNLLSLARDVQ